MSRHFAFRCEIDLSHGDHPYDVLIISQGLQTFDTGDLAMILEQSLERASLPDVIVFLVTDNEFEIVEASCRSDAALMAALERGRTIWSRELVGIDGFGNIARACELGGSQPLGDAKLAALVQAGFEQGLRHVARKQEVVKIAPPGCVFSKPSGDLSEWFLLAADLLHDEAEIVFIAMVVLRRFGNTLDRVRTIYVDTMAIQPLARAVIQLASANGRRLSPVVESFHSYDGLSTLRAEAPERMVCLMSASTSGALARRFAEQTRCAPERILTCLEVVDERNGSSVLLNAQKLFGLDQPGQHRSHHGAAQVQLAGEFFASKARPPRSVVLAARHSGNGLKFLIKPLLGKQVLTLDYAAPRANFPRAIAIDGTALLELEQFRGWLEKRIGWSVPGSARWIIHADDPVSEQMAKHCQDILIARGPEAKIEIVNASELVARQPLTDSSGVLIVSAVVRSGTQLSSISRDLRTFAPTSPRTYLVGIAIPASQSSYKVTESNLRKGLDGWNYVIETWASIPVGHVDNMSSWDEERELLSSIEGEIEEGEFLDWVQARLKMLSGTGTSNSAVKMSGTTSGAPLPLRPGFIYLGNPGPVDDPASVYTIVAATLQNARECDGLPADVRLSSSDFEQVVIAPECFNRFNDGLIQASLIRSAYASELDYSCSAQLSSEMVRIVRKLFQQHKQERGEAALEFAIAFATGRIRLDQHSGSKLIDDELLAGLKDVPSLHGILSVARQRYVVERRNS